MATTPDLAQSPRRINAVSGPGETGREGREDGPEIIQATTSA